MSLERRDILSPPISDNLTWQIVLSFLDLQCNAKSRVNEWLAQIYIFSFRNCHFKLLKKLNEQSIGFLLSKDFLTIHARFCPAIIVKLILWSPQSDLILIPSKFDSHVQYFGSSTIYFSKWHFSMILEKITDFKMEVSIESRRDISLYSYSMPYNKFRTHDSFLVSKPIKPLCNRFIFPSGKHKTGRVFWNGLPLAFVHFHCGGFFDGLFILVNYLPTQHLYLTYWNTVAFSPMLNGMNADAQIQLQIPKLIEKRVWGKYYKTLKVVAVTIETFKVWLW